MRQTMKDLVYLLHLTPSRNLESISLGGLLLSQSRTTPNRLFFTDNEHIERTVEEVFFTHLSKDIAAIGVELLSGNFVHVAPGLYISCLSICPGKLNFLEDCSAEIKSCFA